MDSSERQPKSEAHKLPETTIRRIDKTIKEDFKDKSSDEICKTIIANYNKRPRNDYNEIHFVVEEASTRYLAYRGKSTTTPPVENLFQDGNSIQTTTVSHVIFFMTKKDNIYCLTYGGGHNVVHGVEDTKFPLDVGRYATTKEIRRFDMRNLSGINYAVCYFYRNPTIPDRLQVNGVVTSIQSRVNNAVLESNEDVTLDVEGARVNISRNGVRFMKGMEVGEMCKLIEWLDDDRMRGNGNGCDIMEYITEEKDEELQEKLEDIMFDTIMKYMMKKNDSATSNAATDPPPFDFMYKVYEKHMRGKKFSFYLSREKKTIDANDEIFNSFDDAVNYLKDVLNRALRKLTLTFECGVQHTKQFVSLLHGTVTWEEKEYLIGAGKWKEGDKDVRDKNLKRRLYCSLAKCILDDMAVAESESSQFYFGTTTSASNLKKCSFGINRQKPKKREQQLKDLSSYREALCQLKLYLRKNLKGKFTADGKIIYDLMMNYFHGEVVLDGRIYHKVDGKWFTYDQKFNECLKESFSSLVKRKFKYGPHDNIHLPEVWPPNEDEGFYNQRYSKPEYDGCYYVGDTIKPHNVELFDIMKVLDNAVYLYHVKLGFGAITRDACSQIRNSASVISASRHGGGGVRENYLKKYYELVTTYEGKGKFRSKEKLRLKQVGDEKFLSWFQKKRIVFVYAFADKIEVPKKDSRQEDSADRQDAGRERDETSDVRAEASNTSVPDSEGRQCRNEKLLEYWLQEGNLDKFSTSTIARHDLHHTNLYLEELGFEFAICQIPRRKSKEQAVEVKSEVPE